LLELLKILPQKSADTDFRQLSINPVIKYYFLEIVRYYNQLNYIVKKTLRSIKLDGDFENNFKSQLLYLAYKIIICKTPVAEIIDEYPYLDDGLNRFISKLSHFSWKKALIGKSKVEKLSLRFAFPSFFINKLLHVMDIQTIKENMKHMNSNLQRNAFYIRPMKLFENEDLNEITRIIKKQLIKDGIDVKLDNDIPYIFRISYRDRLKVLNHALYEQKKILFQDKGSIGVIQALDPKPNDFILDMCAAPGVKTNLINLYSLNKAKLILCDINEKRIKKIHKFIDIKNDLNNFTLNIDSTVNIFRSENFFDKILIDAPCTGSGALLENPGLKWKQNSRFLAQNVIIQEKLIENALRLIKPGGIIVFSTCSMYPEEGEYHLIKFKDFIEPIAVPKWLSSGYCIKNEEFSFIGRTFPSIHHCQGFFISKFKRKE